jgi:5'-3' exonuclease
MRALIDGDIIVYRGAASAENEEPWIANVRADRMIQDILEDVGATSYTVFLTGDNNFRRELTPTYKANRPDSRPAHWQTVREFLVAHHRAVICNGYEADDEMGIQQDKIGGSTVICSIDKDLKQIPGKHYNFVKREAVTVKPEEGLKFLYLQSLIGDKSDNIIGVAGIGPVKAERALAELDTEQEWYDKCRELYNDDDRLHLNMQLLYIWQKPNDKWAPPTNNTSDSEPAPTEGDGSGEPTQQQQQQEQHNGN